MSCYRYDLLSIIRMMMMIMMMMMLMVVVVMVVIPTHSHRWTGKGANPYDAWLRHNSPTRMFDPNNWGMAG